MGISIERFQDVVLSKPIDLENQLYSKTLDETPKTMWQSFLIWLDQLLKKIDKDQFDMLPIAQNIESVLYHLQPQFFEDIDNAQIQQGIDNLKSLKAKFSTNPQKKGDVEIILNRAIGKLEDVLADKQAKAEKRALEQKILSYFQSEGINQLFRNELPRLAAVHQDCISCFGFSNLRQIYLDYVKDAEPNPSQLLKIAKLQKEKISDFNKATLTDIGAYFNRPTDVLLLFFPDFKDKPEELKKSLNEGLFTFKNEHLRMLFEAIHNPAAAKKAVEKVAPEHEVLLFNETEQEKESRRTLGELLALRNGTPFKKKEIKAVQQIVPQRVQQPALVSEPVVFSVEAASIGKRADELREMAVKASEDLKAQAVIGTEKVVQLGTELKDKAVIAGEELRKGAEDLRVKASQGLSSAFSFLSGVKL